MADEIKKIKVGGKKYNIVDAGAVRKTGDTMTGDLIMSGSSVKINTPTKAIYTSTAYEGE